jgi:hypothetical protein
LLIIYALVVHFEPFVKEWRLRGGPAAIAIYVGWAVVTAGVGVMSAEIVRTSSVTIGDIRILGMAAAVAFACLILYLVIPHLEAMIDGAPESSRAPD